MAEGLDDDVQTTEPAAKSSNRWARLGIILILLSGVLWAPLPVIPFLSLGTGQKVVLASVLFTGVQIAWWVGAGLAGPKAVRAIRGWLRERLRWKKATGANVDEIP